MTLLTRRLVLAAAVLALAAAPPFPARAQDAAAAAVREVIESQLQAFLRDDGAGAWSHASPGIQGMFQSVDTFMAMVRNGYQPVYRPQSWRFGELRPSPAGPEQEVRIVDTAGEHWTAVYTMEQQPDGSWRISGCRLVKAVPETT